MGKYIEQKTDVEEYQYVNIEPDRGDPYIWMSMINNPLHKYYIKGNKKESNKIKVLKKDKKDDLEIAKKRLCNRANIEIKSDYVVMALKTITIGTELKMHYNW